MPYPAIRAASGTKPGRLKVAVLAVYPPGTAPSIRFRVEALVPLLMGQGVEVSIVSLLTSAEYPAILSRGSVSAGLTLLKAFGRLAGRLPGLRSFDAIWIHREAAPFGPPIIEMLVRYVLGKPTVFDFDDAIWMAEGRESLLMRLMRCRWKVALFCRMSAAVIPGNKYLSQFAGQYNDHVVVVPTSVDTVSYFNAVKVHRKSDRVVVGWTGSRSTNRYLSLIDTMLGELKVEMPFDVKVVSNVRPEVSIAAEFVAWRRETEIADLLSFDIGLMPLDDSEWSQGKCGFKLIQYMALGIPVVASAVGANKEIVRHGVDGFLCRTAEDWKTALRRLVLDPELRQAMGRSARARVEQLYDVADQARSLAAIFKSCASPANAPFAVTRASAE
jgi:glycosyltransferase involved in cell wall biosynthesis